MGRDNHDWGGDARCSYDVIQSQVRVYGGGGGGLIDRMRVG